MTPSEAYLIWLELQKQTAILWDVRTAAIITACVAMAGFVGWATKQILRGRK